MIFLFVTGKNSAYLEDVFSTLHFPLGMVKCFKYKCIDGESVVHASAQKEKCQQGERVLISYIDRLSNRDDCYIPLRFGELIECEQRDGQLYFAVKLREYCHAVDDRRYNDDIVTILGGVVHSKQSDGQWNGALAVKKEGEIYSFVNMTDDSWRYTVERLAERRQFQDCYAIFTRIQIEDAKKRSIEAKKTQGDWGYVLTMGAEYSFAVSYYIPTFNDDSMTKIPVCIEDSAQICGIVKNEWVMESKQNIIRAYTQPLEVLNLKRTAISLNIKEIEINQKKIEYARKPIDIWVKRRIGTGMRRTLVCLIILGMSLCSFLSTLPYETIIKQTKELMKAESGLLFIINILHNVILEAVQMDSLYSLVCTGMNSVLTYFLIKLIGKPEL